MPKPGIFIVEDDGIVALDIETRLTKMGYSVLGKASYGEQAVKEFEKLKPDMVLMDIVLKGNMDGIETAQISSPVLVDL